MSGFVRRCCTKVNTYRARTVITRSGHAKHFFSLKYRPSWRAAIVPARARRQVSGRTASAAATRERGRAGCKLCAEVELLGVGYIRRARTSSTGKATAKPLRGLDLGTAERVVDVARIDTGIVSSDLMGLPPQRLGMSHERALRTRQIAERLRLVQIKRAQPHR
jgi:hypothetical protein